MAIKGWEVMSSLFDAAHYNEPAPGRSGNGYIRFPCAVAAKNAHNPNIFIY